MTGPSTSCYELWRRRCGKVFLSIENGDLFGPNTWQMMNFLHPLDALAPTIPFLFFFCFVSSFRSRSPPGRQGPVSVGFRGLSIEPFSGGGGGGGGGGSQRAVSTLPPPPPKLKAHHTPVTRAPSRSAVFCPDGHLGYTPHHLVPKSVGPGMPLFGLQSCLGQSHPPLPRYIHTRDTQNDSECCVPALWKCPALVSPKRGMDSVRAPKGFEHLRQLSETSVGLRAAVCGVHSTAVVGGGYAGRISPLRKAAKLPRAQFWRKQLHLSPPLQALCFLRRARRDYQRI